MLFRTMSTNKKYGLILPEKLKPKQLVFQASRNVFGNDSDSEDERTKKRDLVHPNNVINRKAKVVQEKAVSEDPTVYQYDEIYDSMTSNEKKLKSKSDADKKPRYVENLLRTAKKRKIENEQRIEKQIQKEREKEGDEFADKEIFVTSAYKKKLEELRLEEEKEKHEEYLESIGDVTKQADLSGFSRFLYQQKLGNTKSSDTNVSNTKDINEEISKKEQVKRNYRKRNSSESKLKLSEGEIEDSDEEINRVNLEDIREAKKAKVNVDKNLDADSDFMDESSEDDCSNNTESIKNANEKENHAESCSPKRDSESITVKEVKEKLYTQTVEEKEPAPKIDIWKKRTVGEIFEQALQRYCERKKARGC